MANGGLQEHLYPINGNKTVSSELNWETRLRIALEAEKGLEYLHENIGQTWFRESWWTCFDPSLGHPGICRSRIRSAEHLTTKSDVYSYGAVLLELLTGRVPVDTKRPPGEAVLVSWALPQLTDRDKVGQIMYPALESQYLMKEVIQVAAIAAMCIQPEADYRPWMADVVQSLVPFIQKSQVILKCK